MEDYEIDIANVLDISQSFNKPSVWYHLSMFDNTYHILWCVLFCDIYIDRYYKQNFVQHRVHCVAEVIHIIEIFKW